MIYMKLIATLLFILLSAGCTMQEKEGFQNFVSSLNQQSQYQRNQLNSNLGLLNVRHKIYNNSGQNVGYYRSNNSDLLNSRNKIYNNNGKNIGYWK